MTVDILGTPYSIEYKSEQEDSSMINADGYCDKTSKRLVIATKTDKCDLDDFEWYQKKVLRHEIVHAFMYESGLGENWEHKNIGQEETVVDWIAFQGIKIYNAWQQANCI